MEGQGVASARTLHVALGIGGVLLVAQLFVLVLSLNQISSTRDHVAATDAKATAVFRAVKPVADQASESLAGAQPLTEAVLPAARDAAKLLRFLGGETDEVQVVLDAFPTLSAGFRGLSAALIPVLEALDPASVQASLAEVGPALASVDALAARLTDGDRLVALLDQAAGLLGEVDRRELPRRAVQADRTLRRVLAIQSETLDVQRDALAVQRRSLQVQRQSLDHVRSLDEKTGGDILSP
jgi:hypothetical protein